MSKRTAVFPREVVPKAKLLFFIFDAVAPFYMSKKVCQPRASIIIKRFAKKTDTFLEVAKNVYMNKAIRFEKELPAPFCMQEINGRCVFC